MYQQSASKMYAQIDVESEILNATPYQLIQILFNGALSALRRALILMEQVKAKIFLKPLILLVTD